MDPLGDALHHLRMRGTFYSRCDFTAPWGLDLPPFEDSLMFHVVTAGRCWVEVDGAEPRQLQAGDVALVPHGEGHRMASEPGEPGVPLFDLPHDYQSDQYEVLRQGGGGAATGLLCAVIRFDDPTARQLVKLLPRTIVVDASDLSHAEWMHSTLRFMASEARSPRAGGEAVMTRLADVLLIQTIRSWIEHDPAAQTGWLGALRDPQVGGAITLMQREPARTWTVESLSNEVAMSRSAFAARFAELVGEPPMRYLAQWRMQVALTLLADERVSVGEIGRRLGYESEAAFSRAFKRFVGVAPGAARRASEAQRVSRS